MKTLVEKEIRLMLPAFCVAMVLATMPAWLVPDPRNAGQLTTWLYVFGVMTMALSTFGREVGLKTFPFILAQPFERASMWRIKIVVLAVSTALVFVAWWHCCDLASADRAEHLLPLSVLFTAMLISGALWITLLVRQVIAAFWLSLLIPSAIGVVLQLLGAADWMVTTALGLYGVAGFLLARREFLHFQDTAWTGGVISFGSARAVAAQRATTRERRPWAALVLKEIQMQQITLAGMACLLVLHIGAVVSRKAGANTFGKATLWALEIFGLLWLSAPLVAGSQCVAEERKLGTMAAHLCLPVSRRGQWIVKLVTSLFIGALVSGTLFWSVQLWLGGPSLGECIVVFSVIWMFGFYGSTLANGILQGLGAAVLTIMGVWACFDATARSARSSGTYSGFYLSQEFLLLLVGFPAVLAVLVWLSYYNFGNASESMRLWRRNALVLGVTVAGSVCFTTAFYNRAWESFTPMEPPRGPARISLEKPPVFHAHFVGLTARFEDGSLWVDRLAEGPERRWSEPDWGKKFFRPGAIENEPDSGGWGEFASLGGAGFVPGSNWIAATANAQETIALRSDGSLWVSERPQNFWGRDASKPVEKPAPLVRFGDAADWQSLARRSEHTILLLKREGTLWEWGTNFSEEPGLWVLGTNSSAGPGFRSLRDYQVRRLGGDSDWARMLWDGGAAWGFLWKNDGSAWWLHDEDIYGRDNADIYGRDYSKSRLQRVIEPQTYFEGTNSRYVSLPGKGKRVLLPFRGHTPGTSLERLPILDDVHWQSLANCPDRSGLVAVREDGTLWFWDENEDRNLRLTGVRGSAPAQIGSESDWADLAGSSQSLVARKRDGSLLKWTWEWSWHPGIHYYGMRCDPLGSLRAPAVRLGTSSDWVGLAEVDQRTVSLAADGNLWVWPPETSWQDRTPFMAASKKTRRIENIFGARE